MIFEVRKWVILCDYWFWNKLLPWILWFLLTLNFKQKSDSLQINSNKVRMCVILLFYCYIIATFLMIISLINILYLSINTVFNYLISTYSLYIIHPSIFLRYITFVDILMLIPRRSVFGLPPPPFTPPCTQT